MTAETSNSEVVKRAYAGFNAADIETLLTLYHEDASWHTPGKSPIAGSRKGRDAVFAHYGTYGGEASGFQAELMTLFESEDGRVVGLHRNTGERNGKQLDVMCCIVFELKDGPIYDGREYFYDLHAWDAFWS